jgi:hypothetical protein
MPRVPASYEKYELEDLKSWANQTLDWLKDNFGYSEGDFICGNMQEPQSCIIANAISSCTGGTVEVIPTNIDDTQDCGYYRPFVEDEDQRWDGKFIHEYEDNIVQAFRLPEFANNLALAFDEEFYPEYDCTFDSDLNPEVEIERI